MNPRRNVEEIIRSFRASLAGAVAREVDWSRIQTLQGLVPPAAVIGCLEYRLKAPNGAVDFQVAMSMDRQTRQRIQAFLVASPPFPDRPSWQGVHAFLEAWVDEGSPIHRGVHSAWLEFDMDPGATGIPEPFLYLSAASEPFKTSVSQGDHAPAIQEILDAGLGRLCPEGIRPAVRDRIADCVRRLPLGTRYVHAAVMPARNIEAARLVTSVPLAHLPDYLKAIEWPGVPEEVVATLEPLGIHSSHLPLHIDVSDRVHPKLGFEFFYPTSPHEDLRWKILFDELERVGACAPDRRAAASDWPNREGEPFVPTLRYLTVKAVLRTDEPLEAKAYLPFTATAEPPEGNPGA